ncbi:leucine-rich repeat-containing protein 43-like [Nematolebias whitei]|uniref:leucine-rich repeat-containing protein 43-like n=1 Tax=Nematolebias whitei TaxID=451745 RepID=UPI0018998398|nr:leucine-rich repeat-containing protein 43-like [Nematolebias whitei]
MSSKTLSAVLEKKIRRLCLTDFPCGNGTWFCCQRGTKDSTEEPETESIDALVDMLDCPRSPWKHEDESWSPQASALRLLAIIKPQQLNSNFIHSYFTTLHIRGKNVSVIDEGLLRFSKLKELVLSANVISEIPAENLPCTLKVLDVRANRVSSLNGLTKHPPPRLQYLGLGSNSLGSHKDATHLTGSHWPQLVCLDLSDCEFQDQQALLSTLSTLPCLKTLFLFGNPFTLAPSYPGFTVDSLPQLTYLDASWISAEERHAFRGLATMSGLLVNVASITVSLSRLRGIPDPLMAANKNAPDFPLITCSYFITYQFLSPSTPNKLTLDSASQPDTRSTLGVTEESKDDKLMKCEGGASTPDTGVSTFSSDETYAGIERLSQHNTSKLSWTELVDFSDTQTFTVSSLGDLKKFLNQGLYLRLEEEKILSWPAASEAKRGKKEESPAKPVTTKDKPKDKKRKSVPDLVQGHPVRRTLGSAHVSLQSLVQGGQKVNVICDFGPLRTDDEEAEQTLQQEHGNKIKEEKKKEDKKQNQRGESGKMTKNKVLSKGKKKEPERQDVIAHTDETACVQLEPVTVELRVELEKWQSASEAKHLKPTQQNRSSSRTE